MDVFKRRIFLFLLDLVANIISSMPNLAKKLQVLAQHIQSTQVDGETFQIFKDLNIIMDKDELHSYFYGLYIDDVDVILGYPWMQSVGTINNNVETKFLNIWYKKKKITL